MGELMHDPGTGQGNEARYLRLSCAGRAYDFIGAGIKLV